MNTPTVEEVTATTKWLAKLDTLDRMNVLGIINLPSAEQVIAKMPKDHKDRRHLEILLFAKQTKKKK